ncbi:DUF4259 domain-containing protein [Actinomadura verrucosospora]|uniref:DUF4259 domain-containing protein n=1 Tax=Actinomadura verrucosospora TaxID=46165 RepID=UPI0031EE8269
MSVGDLDHCEVALGTWGYGPFDNDYAQDLLEDLAKADDIVDRLREVMSRVADAPGPVDSISGDDALVAAALTAVRSGGMVVDPDTEEDLIDLMFLCPEDLRSLAARTFDRLLNPVENKWYDLWTLSNGIAQVTAEFEPYRQALSDP